MRKQQIQGSEFADTDLEYSVCSHLQPILKLLTENGNGYDSSKPLDRSRGGSTCLLSKPIAFNLIEDHFEIPTFIELRKPDQSVVCRRCWCDLAASNE